MNLIALHGTIDHDIYQAVTDYNLIVRFLSGDSMSVYDLTLAEQAKSCLVGRLKDPKINFERIFMDVAEQILKSGHQYQ